MVMPDSALQPAVQPYAQAKKSPRMRAFSLRCLRLELTVPCLVDTSLVVNELITAFVNGHYAVGNVIAVTL